MRLRLAAALLVALLPLSPLLALDGPEWKRDVVCVGVPLTKRVAFVVDVSGSMVGAPFDAAVGEVGRVLSMFPDDGWLKVYSFANEVHVFDATTFGLTYDPANPDCLCDENLWVRMPNKEAVDAAVKWLRGKGAMGGTALTEGLSGALSSNKEDDLSVVLIHDGEPNGTRSSALEEALALSKRAGKRWGEEGEAFMPIHIVGVNPSLPAGLVTDDAGDSFLRALAERTKGTYVRHTLVNAEPELWPH